MRTGFTCSTFDLLHAGHIIMLEEAKRNCDYLIVGLQVDPTLDRPDTKNRPVQSIVERQIQLEGCQYIDYIIVYQSEQDLMDILTICNIDVRFLGEDYIDKDFTGKQYCIDNGIEIYYNKRKHRFSTTELRQRAGLSKTDI